MERKKAIRKKEVRRYCQLMTTTAGTSYRHVTRTQACTHTCMHPCMRAHRHIKGVKAAEKVVDYKCAALSVSMCFLKRLSYYSV